MDTPLQSNKNENLIEPEQSKQPDVNIDQMFTGKNGQISGAPFIINFGNIPIIIILILSIIEIYSYSYIFF